jgi:hypothetical protein
MLMSFWSREQNTGTYWTGVAIVSVEADLTRKICPRRQEKPDYPVIQPAPK